MRCRFGSPWRKMLKFISRSILATTILLLAPAVFARHRVFDVDPEASAVSFSLGDVLHSVHGTFRVHKGSIDFDSVASKISGSVDVAAGSGKSGNDTRDRKMTAEILD